MQPDHIKWQWSLKSGRTSLVIETLTRISTMTCIPTFMWWRIQYQSLPFIGTHLKYIETQIYQETFALHIRGNILKQKPGGIHHIYQISYHSETSQSLLNFNIIISLTITADTITTHKYAQPSIVISRNFLTIFYGFHNDSPKTTHVTRLLPS